ncbi:Superfamily II DNA or RNA helicase [Epibacterium ulvae]|uniref:Superfamily II DNA or RNA helicase n=1 Tax=Epibacterium ulvae TaxID=1156985 RepID=A0A1G5PJ13_9RHOB|nr:DEAD/DEAH box helicase [Epibacterium ulvae]SCZ49505.1 Superfamily II DNA or RNA helicase [Epibacterium ulvae]
MNDETATTAQNSLGSTTLQYEATGASKSTNDLGMRAMQARVWDKRDAQHLLVKSPPASGKSRAAMFVGLEKLRTSATARVVIAVPERSIGASFRDTALAQHGFHSDWQLDVDLCTIGSETGRKVDELISFLNGEGGNTALCTHSTLRSAYAKTNDVSLFDRTLVCVDELHHASSDENSRLGNLLRGLIDRAGEVGSDAAHILAMTGSYFRGDGTAVLHPEDEARFEKVIYTYYEQLNGYEHLKTLRINFRFYQGKYLDAIGEALDPNLKTIVHIPHVGSTEAGGVNKMFAVDAIVDAIGDRLGENATTTLDPATGFVHLSAGGKTLRIANLVDDSADRDQVLSSLRAVQGREDVDVIIALGMAKEGFDWVWCEHVLTVGYRGSLTEVVQIIGRATRDAPGKEEAQFTNLVSAPFAKDEAITRAVNDMLKAISVSLLMEQVMAPVFKFRTHKGADQFDGTPGEQGDDAPVTNAGEIEIVGMPEINQEAVEAIETDFNDLFADVQSDPRTLTVMINPDDHHTDVMYDLVVTDVIKKRYPSFSDAQVEDAVGLFGVRAGLGREVAKDPSIIQTPGMSEGEQALFEMPEQGTDTQASDGPNAGDRFVQQAKRFINVRELQVDLLGGRRDFDDAYELLSKELSEELLARLHGEVRALKVNMTQEEAERLYDRVKEFIARESREPNLNAPNGREVRLAEALAFLRKLSREKRAAMAGADMQGASDA